MLNKYNALIDKGYDYFFSHSFNHRFESIILFMAIGGFLIHLGLIFLQTYQIIHIPTAHPELLEDPITAIYTPFSFILVYEVYLLVQSLPRSFSTSIAKQYEIISLIVIRRIFKDISNIELSKNWLDYKYNVQLTIDVVGFLIMFLLIYWFNRLKRKKPNVPDPPKINQFINIKKVISIFLVPILIILATYSLVEWLIELRLYNNGVLDELRDINNVFYDEFFNILIIVDVFILMVSLFFTSRYSQLIRNTGFVISTILIRFSFSATGIVNMGLIVASILFGALILALYNMVEKQEQRTIEKEAETHS